MLSIGNLEGTEAKHLIEIPGLLSYLGKGDVNAEIKGINDSAARIPGEVLGQPAHRRREDELHAERADDLLDVPTHDRRGAGLDVATAIAALWATRRKAMERDGGPAAVDARPLVALDDRRRPALPDRRELLRLDLHRGRPPAVDRLGLRRPRPVSRRRSRPPRSRSPLAVYTLVYAAAAVVEVKPFLHYIRLGAEAVPDPVHHDRDEDAPSSTRTDRRRDSTEKEIDMELSTVWFILIAVLWTGYFVLEGFDFGVGMLLPILSRSSDPKEADLRRRVMLTTIGPVWDGNEVWVLTRC